MSHSGVVVCDSDESPCCVIMWVIVDAQQRLRVRSRETLPPGKPARDH